MELAAEYARREIGDALYETMLRQPGPTRASVILRALPADVGVGPAAAREFLETDPRFIEIDGRRDLRARADTAASSFNITVQRIIEELGRAVDLPVIAAFFAAATARDIAYYEGLIASLTERADVAVAVDGKLVPVSWVLIPEGDTEEDVLFYCDLDTDEELQRLMPACADENLRGAAPVETALNVIRAADQPITNRVLQFLVYRLHPDRFEPLSLLSEMWADERLYCAPGMRWVAGEMRAPVAAEVARLDADAGEDAPKITADLAGLVAEPLPPEHPGYFIEDDDLGLIHDMVNNSKRAVSLDELLTEALELSPESPQLQAAAHSIHDLLCEDPAVIQLDATTFMGPGAIPTWVREVPEELAPVPGKPGEDVILMEDGLRPGLAEKIRDPFVEDIGSEDVTVDEDTMTSDETFYALTFPHRVAGTMKLRKMDEEFFDIQAPIARITMVDGGGDAHEVWANAETGLLLGLADLYAALDLMPGALLALVPGEGDGQFAIEVAGEDETCAIGEARIDALLELRQQLEAKGAGLYEAVREIVAAHADGVTFEILQAEVDVVRRATRLQLASLLSYYQCFRPQDGQGDVWGFAADAVAAGAIATKERFVIQDQGDAD